MECLLAAIQANDVSFIEKISEKDLGNDPTILHYAVGLGNAETVKALLKAGARKWINAFDDVGLTPLAWAAKNDNLELVQLLIASGADANARDETKNGNTPLREAIETCNSKIVEFLIRAGADPKIPGWMQLTSIDIALERLEISDTPENRKIIELVLNNSNFK